MKYDIFISYKRRGASSATAAYLYELLRQKGYNVFFDRKEMRSGKFNDQLLEHISNATDIIILLEDGSLASWFDYRSNKKGRSFGGLGISASSEMAKSIQEEEPYKTDWFCREIIYALSLTGKNIVPILLNGYTMPGKSELPPEMEDLSLHNALSLDISEIEEFYDKYFVEQGYLKSRPSNLSLTKRYNNKGGVVGCFLFYTDVDSCDLYECGELIATLTDNEDEWHPFRYPVSFAGEHRFKVINNDSCEVITIKREISANCQQYVQIQFTDTRNIWALTEEEINSQQDKKVLYNWGVWLFDGNSKHEPDIKRSFDCLSRAVSLGSQEALLFINNQGYGLVSQKKAPLEVAFKWYQIAAEHGNIDAQINMGNAYIESYGVKQDYRKALEWFQKAAEQGESDAQYNIGYMYTNGYGVEQDYQKAFEWFMKAAEQGNANATNNIGYMYENGYGVEQDYQKAFEWYMKAAQQGNIEAQYNIGNMYFNGMGIEKNYEEAFSWMEKAALQGHTPAMTGLGICYYYGYGVKRSKDTGRSWVNKAAIMGDEYAKETLQRMK